LGTHAVTLNGYLGASGIIPFLNASLGVFILVRTSNPDSDAVQGLRLADGRTIAQSMADLVAELGQSHIGSCGLSSVGAVVGATKSADSVALRARMPQQFFLIPGYGAQGGTAADILALRRSDGRGILVTASRSVLYPSDGGSDWRHEIARAAKSFASEVAGALAQA
jgi:orotidine-5'-phosphate decarboxylase